MEHSIRFEIDATRYYIWRQGEWCFDASVGGVEGETVHLDVGISYPRTPGVVNLRRFPVTSDEGVCLEIERAGGDRDEVTMSLDAVQGSQVMLRFDLPEGVQLQQMEDDTEAAAG